MLTDGSDAAEAEKFLAAFRLVRSRRFAEAVAAYDSILERWPNRPHVWVNRGVALQGLSRLDEAIESFERALTIRPDDVGALINRGAVHNWAMRYDDALADYDRAVELEPQNEAALLGRSTVLSAMGRFAEAQADSETVLEFRPGSGGAHYNRSLLLLSQGDYKEGFREHEWRFGTDSILGRHRFPQPVWTGGDTFRRVLVHCEQGLGDSIQCARYIQPMLRRCAEVYLEAPAALVRLFGKLGVEVIRRDDELPEFDLHCPIMSLPAVFGTAINTIPPPFWPAFGGGANKHIAKLKQLPGKKVGLCWSSGVRREQPIAVAMQKRKSIPTSVVASLLDVPGVTFVNLQKDMPDEGMLDIFDPMPACADLADTASVIDALDLVIAVDSAVAHVAGTVRKPLWVLNRFDICWRWLSGNVPAPWYPGACIYRQSEPARWGDVIAQVKHDLPEFINAS